MFLTWYEQTGITIQMQNYLASIQENQDLISWDYVQNSLNPNFKEMVVHLFPWQEERFKLLNPWTYIAWLIDDKISSFVWTPEDWLKYRIDYDKIVETLLTTWYLMLKAYSTKSEWWKVEAVDWSKYYFDWVTEFFIEQYKIDSLDNTTWNIAQTKYYLYVQTFSNNILKNQLFEIQQNILSVWKKVSLDLIPELQWRPDEQIIMETEKLVYSIKLESSLIKKVKSIIYSIERKWAEADKQFQNYMEQFMVFNNIEVPADATKTVYQDWIQYKVTDFSKLWKNVETNADNWTWTIEIIKNWNELIKEALEFSERQIRQISAITDIPPIYLWLDSNQWNDSGTSITKSSWPLFKRVERYRTWIENLFWDISQILKSVKVAFVWPSIATADPDEILDSEIKKVEAWLTSKKRAIMKIHSVDEIWAQAILDEIAEEIPTQTIPTV